MKEFIEFIVKHLVDKPDEVRVSIVEGEQSIIYELHVGQGDMGAVIGKRGSHAMALRTLLYAASGKTKKRATLEIVE